MDFSPPFEENIEWEGESRVISVGVVRKTRCPMEQPDPETVALRFNERINLNRSRDSEGDQSEHLVGTAFSLAI